MCLEAAAFLFLPLFFPFWLSSAQIPLLSGQQSPLSPSSSTTADMNGSRMVLLWLSPEWC